MPPTIRVNARTYAWTRRRRRKNNIGRVFDLNTHPEEMDVEEEEDEKEKEKEKE